VIALATPFCVWALMITYCSSTIISKASSSGFSGVTSFPEVLIKTAWMT
jgi:hypothetical protein